MSEISPAPTSPAASFAGFVCAPAPDGGRVNAFLFHPGGERALLIDVVDAVSADARGALLDRYAETAAAEGYAFDRQAADGELIEQAAKAAASPAAASTDPAAVLRRVGLSVVAVSADAGVITYSEATARTGAVPRAATVKYEDALQLVGRDHARKLVRKRTRDTPPGSVSLAEFKEALALEAAAGPDVGAGGRGRGVWDGPDAGSGLLINDGRAVYTYNGARTADFEGHRAGGRAVLRGGEEWAGPEVRAAIEAMTRNRAAAAYGRLVTILSQWRWSAASGAVIAAALIVATYVQAVLRARPRIAVLGESDSGKSTLVAEVLTPLFNGPTDFAATFENHSAAGVRDTVRHDSRPVVLDEFENSAQRDATLALFRVATRGGRIVRSSSAGVARETELRVLPWVLAIEPGDLATQDRNRQIDVALEIPSKDSPDPTLPTEGELFGLRAELIAAAVWAVRKSEELAKEIRRPTPPGADRRLVELLAVPAAFDAVLRHGRDVAPEAARATLEAFAADHTREAPVATGRRLLDDILSHPIRVVYDGRVCERSVGEVVQTALRSGASADALRDERRALELNGLRVIDTRWVRKGGGDKLPAGLFISNRVGTTLLKGTAWEGMGLGTILERVPGAIEENQAVNKVAARGVHLPAESLGLAVDDCIDAYVDASHAGGTSAHAKSVG